MGLEAPPDIIDVNKDDDFIDDEYGVPHDLADSDDEVLTNDDDDDVVVVYSSEEEDCGDGGGDDPSRPPPYPIRTGCRGVGGQKATIGGRGAGRLGTRVSHFDLQLLDLASRTLLVSQHLHQCFPWNPVCSIVTNSFNVGVPPRQSISKWSTCSKLDLACDGEVAYVEYKFHFLKPLSQTNDSFSTLKIKGLAFQEVTIGALTSSALCPSATSRIMAIIAISTASISFILSQRIEYKILIGD
nr:hypothetical protein [Tanacetum cinerariifolium]